MSQMARFKDQTVEELKALYLELSKTIFEIKNELRAAGKLDKPHLLHEKKRDRARVLTELKNRGEKVRYEG